MRGGESGVADLVGSRDAAVTKIGSPTRARLCSFDIGQLEAHQRDVDINACAVQAAVRRNADIAMGARWNLVAAVPIVARGDRCWGQC